MSGSSRYDRSLLLTQEGTASTGEPLVSIRDATWEHQAAALGQGYKSLLEYAVDELVAEVREMKVRLDRLEDLVGELRRALPQ